MRAPQPTSEASDNKLTSGTGREKDTPSRSWATRVHQRRYSQQRGDQETWNWSSRKSHWSLRQGWSSLIRSIPSGTRKVRDDKWPSRRCQRDAGGDGVDRKSSSSRRRLPTRIGGGRAIKGKDRISMPRYTSDEFWIGQDESIVHTCGGWRKWEP